MALSLGSALATKVYLGATEINLAYFGATQVYTSSAFSAEAQNYFDRLDTAGDTTYVDYKQPLANYIDSLVTLGGAYWDDMNSAASFVGVGIQGVTVPLRDGMTALTNNNFVAGDLNQLTGLKGGNTKELATGISDNQFTTSNASASVYATEAATTGAHLSNDYNNGAVSLRVGSPTFVCLRGLATNTSIVTAGVTGLIGLTRNTDTDLDGRASQTNVTEANAGTLPRNSEIFVFSRNAAQFADSRLATYHLGSALNLATLEGLQETLLSEIRTAHTFVAAASYFSRLVAAGDTAHVAYKQPLTNYITSLVELGGAYWENMESSASFVGVGIQGVTVPLKDGVPALTNNNFVAGDLLQTTGLKGDALTKYFDLNVLGSVVEQDNASISVYITEADGAFGFHMGHQGNRLTLRNNPYVELNGAAAVPTNGKPTSKIFGGSRTTSTDVDVRNNQVTSTISNTSLSPSASTMFLFARVTSASSKARLATYHIGSALDLATLEGLQATLLAEIAGIGFSTEAANYFSRLANAGDTTFLAYRQPLANYIDSLVALGGAYWDDMKSATSFVGVGIQGVTVPLRDGMTVPTNNNFVAGDLNQLTGLKGDASTKYLDTGFNEGSLSQNDSSISVYLTTDRDVVTTSSYIGGTIGVFAIVDNATGFRSRHMSSSLKTNGTSTAVGGIIGISRDNSSDYDWRDVDANGTNIDPSTAQGNIDVEVFASNGGNFLCSARLATYHAGPALNLATLEGLQDTLITEIAAI